MLSSQPEPFQHWYTACWHGLTAPSLSTFKRAALMAESWRKKYRFWTFKSRLTIWLRGEEAAARVAQRYADLWTFTHSGWWVMIGASLGAYITALIGLNYWFGTGTWSQQVPGAVLPGPGSLNGIPDTLGESVRSYAFLGLLWGWLTMMLFHFVTITRGSLAYLIGGGKRFSQLEFASASFFAPLELLIGLLRTLPYLGVVFIVIRIAYGIIVSTIIIKAVYGFPWWKAVFSNSVATILGVGVFALWLGPYTIMLWQTLVH